MKRWIQNQITQFDTWYDILVQFFQTANFNLIYYSAEYDIKLCTSSAPALGSVSETKYTLCNFFKKSLFFLRPGGELVERKVLKRSKAIETSPLFNLSTLTRKGERVTGAEF